MIYAGFWRRFVAIFIDAVILTIPSLVINQIVPYAGALLFGFIYYPLFISSPLQATPGKAIMGVAVIDENGQTLTLKAAIIRYACSFLSGLCLGLGYFMSLFTVKRQTFHDMVAASVVIVKTAPEINYFHVWLAEIKKLGGDHTTGQDSLKTTYANTSKASDDNATKAIEDLHKLFQSGAI